MLALSPQEATSYVTSTNNFLFDGESAEILPAVPITYSKDDYWVVAAASGTTINAYIPISDETKEIPKGDIAVRKLIESAIVLRKTQQYKNENSLNWHFSISNRNYFYDLASAYTEMIPKVINVKTELAKLSGTSELEGLAEDIQGDLEDMVENSNTLAGLIDESMAFETELLSEPDTNMINDYESLNANFFEAISEYKNSYTALSLNLSALQGGIGGLDSATYNEKLALNSGLELPVQTAKLSSFFNDVDAANQNMNQIFSSTSRVDTYVATLDTRVLRNEAWSILYGTDDDILSADSRFETLEDASENILSEDNVAYWIAEDEVEALRVNWTQAKSRYESAKYETAKNSAEDAKENVLAILEAGLKSTDQEIPQELIINAIIILAVIGLGLFVFEKYKQRKEISEMKEGDDYEAYK